MYNYAQAAWITWQAERMQFNYVVREQREAGHQAALRSPASETGNGSSTRSQPELKLAS